MSREIDNKVVAELIKINERLIVIEVDLKEHMRRTDILEQLHQDNQKRLELLERPRQAREYFVNVVVDISKFIGFLLGVLAILRYVGKI